MKHVPIALLFFVAPAFAEELPINRAVTQATIAATICKPGWTKAVRPPFRVTEQIRRDKLRAAGWTEADNDRFELDYIIPLSLGGAPDDEQRDADDHERGDEAEDGSEHGGHGAPEPTRRPRAPSSRSSAPPR